MCNYSIFEGIILLEITSVSYVCRKFPARLDFSISRHRLLTEMAFMFVYANAPVISFSCEEVIVKALAIRSRCNLLYHLFLSTYIVTIRSRIGDMNSDGMWSHCSDVIMETMASQITNLPIVYSTVYSGADQRKHQCSASLAFVRGIHRISMKFVSRGPICY